MAQKSLTQLDSDIQALRARLEAAESEYKGRKDAQIARAATTLAKLDPAFSAALDRIMDGRAVRAPVKAPKGAP